MSRARDLADAGSKANFLDNVSADINTTYAPLASPAFTGTPDFSGITSLTHKQDMLSLDGVHNGELDAGIIGNGVTREADFNIPNFNLNLSSGQNRIISFGTKGIHIYGVVDSTGTGNSSARTGIYSESSSSGSLQVIHLKGYVAKTGTRNDIGTVHSAGDTMNVIERVNGYLQGPSINAVGIGTLSPSSSRWSLQFNSSEDYELQLASADGGTFYYSLFGFKV